MSHYRWQVPISQVYNYVRKIRATKAKDRKGRPVTLGPDLPFYAYILADITPSLETQAENANFIRSPDSMGYFGYNSRLRTYVEIMSFKKVVVDAKKRNTAFFRRLGIS